MPPTLAPAPAHADRLTRAFNSRRIPKLDALRALNALAVMLYHLGCPVPSGFGVTCFFVSSGFLITRLLLDEHQKTGEVSLRNFYLRRAFRIFPAFYVFWFFVIGGLLLKHGHIIWGQAISSFFYVSNYYQGLNHYPGTAFSRTWSLGVEEQFYILWPLLFARVAARPARLMKILASIIVSIWILRVVLVVEGASEQYLYTAFECRADAILLGCALAIALRSRALPWLWQTLCRSRWCLVLSLGVLGLAQLPYRFGTAYRDTVGNIVEPLLLSVIIVQLLGIEWRALDWMDSRPARFLGAISYSTYLYHGIPAWPHWLPGVLKIAPSYLLATVSYFAVEKPFLSIRDAWFKKDKTAAQPARKVA